MCEIQNSRWIQHHQNISARLSFVWNMLFPSIKSAETKKKYRYHDLSDQTLPTKNIQKHHPPPTFVPIKCTPEILNIATYERKYTPSNWYATWK